MELAHRRPPRLGHTLSLASGLPLVAIDRRSNADAFDHTDKASAEQRPPMRRVVADIAEEADWPVQGFSGRPIGAPKKI